MDTNSITITLLQKRKRSCVIKLITFFFLCVMVLQHLYNVCSKKNDFILCNTDWAKKNYLINVMHIRIPIRISEDLLSSFSKYPAAFKNRTKIPAIMYLVPTSNGALRWVCVTKLNKFL